MARLCGAVAVVVAARYTHSLVVLSLCLAVAHLLGGLAQWMAAKRLLPRLSAAWRHVRGSTALELARYCVGLSVWAFSMLLVSGLDVTVVGHFRFPAVGIYSVAATLSMFYAGLNQSVISALMTPIAALHARGQHQEIAAILLKVTRLNAIGNLILLFACIAYAPAMLRVWVGADYAAQAYPLFVLLVLAQAIRLLANPYAVTLVAIGRQSQGLLPAISEAVVNLLLSVAGMMAFGPVGVAAGTLAGACVGVGVLLLWTVARVDKELRVSTRDLLRHGVVRPIFIVWPLMACTDLSHTWPLWRTPITLLGLFMTAALLLRSERKRRPTVPKANALSPAA